MAGVQLQWSRDGEQFLLESLGSDNFTGRLMVWDSDTHALRVNMSHSHLSHAAGWRDGKPVLATVDAQGDLPDIDHDDFVSVWDVERNEISMRLEGHTADIREIAISPEGQYLASGAEDNTVRIWDLETGETVQELEHEDFPLKLSWSPESDLVVSVTSGNLARLWDIEGNLHHEWISDHWTLNVQWRDNMMVESYGGIVRLWGVPTERECVLTASRTVNRYWQPSLDSNNLGALESRPWVAVGLTTVGQYDWYQLADGSWVRADLVEVSDACDQL